MKYTGIKNRIIDARQTDDGLILEDCIGVTISNWTIHGGSPNLLLLNCHGCSIVNCHFANPANKPDESGNGPHSILLDKCINCEVSGCHVTRLKYTEMGIGLYMCQSCSVLRNTINGQSVRQSADAITVDYGSKNCRVSGNYIDLTYLGHKSGHKGVVVGSGTGHVVELGSGGIIGSVEDHPLSVASYYDAAGNPLEDDTDPSAAPVSATIIGFKKDLVYVGPRCSVKFQGV